MRPSATTRTELFSKLAACPETEHAILELFDGATKPVAVAHEGHIWVSMGPLFSLCMNRTIAQRLSAMLANAVLSPESKPSRRPKAVSP